MSGDATFERRRFNKIVGGAVATAGLMSGVSGVKGQQEEEQVRSSEAIWESGGTSRTSSTIVDGTAYLVVNTTLYAVNVGDGSEEWSFNLSEGRYGRVSTPTVVDGSVYIVSSLEESKLRSIEADSGEEEWVITSANGFVTNPRYPPTVADGTVYAMGGGGVDSNNLIHALNSETGEIEWQYARPESTSPASAPTVVGDTVFFGVYGGPGGTGGLYALNKENGEERWRFTEFDSVISEPTVSDGNVYIGGGKGSVRRPRERNIRNRCGVR